MISRVITEEELVEVNRCLIYDPVTGVFTRKIPLGRFRAAVCDILPKLTRRINE